MKIEWSNYPGDHHSESIEDFVTNSLLYKCVSGRFNTYKTKIPLEDQPLHITKCLTRLLEFLIKKNLINNKEFLEILGDSHYELYTKEIEIKNDDD